ncbi:hypothetical protein [Streptomyces sp. NPDC017673]|uniref:hypothetical protein n=1 Tax=unclassified Streptomyces TaxID=2593676 RepID=UPI00378F3492
MARPATRRVPRLVLLHLVVFFIVDTAVPVLRRDRPTSPYFRAYTAVPVLGGSCAALATEVEAVVWTRWLTVIAVGVALGAVAALHRRRPSSWTARRCRLM